MTKRDRAVFVEAFDELESEGFFDELREKAQARKLHGKVRAGAAPMMLSISSARGTSAEALKAGKKSGKKIPASASSRNAAGKIFLAASKK